VTVNIFSLLAVSIATGASPKNAYWLKGQIKEMKAYFLAPDYEKMKTNPALYLMLYAQVIEDFGWDVMKKVLSSYEKDAQSELPKNDQ
jgi:hypothetical protein